MSALTYGLICVYEIDKSSDSESSEGEGDEESEAEGGGNNLNVKDVPQEVSELRLRMEDYYRASTKHMDRCKEICKTFDLSEAINHYDFFVEGVKNAIIAYRERRSMGTMNSAKMTYNARRTVDAILRECYGKAFDVAREVQRKELQRTKRKRPKTYSKSDLVRIGCKHSASCFENLSCLNWFNKIQCPPNCLKGEACKNYFLNKKTSYTLVFQGASHLHTASFLLSFYFSTT